MIQAISPRVFEAAALGTAMINFTGRYSDVIEPWTHYVPLEKDFSNFDEVVAAIRDDAVLEGMATRAHADLVASGEYSLRRFVQGFDGEIAARAQAPQRERRSPLARAASRRLLSIEQLRSPARRAELPLVAALRARAGRRTGSRVIARFPEIEALEGLASSSDALRDHTGRVRQDLVRLAAAAAAHVRELHYFGLPFDVHLELDEQERRLTLVSTRGPSQDASERTLLRERIAAAIREGRVEEIVWNNSSIGAHLTFLSVPVSSLEIGYHVMNAAYRFTTLTELARLDPAKVIAAFEPLFRSRPDAPVHELNPKLLTLVRTASAPGPVAARGAAALRATLTSSELRRLLKAYLASPPARAEIPIDLVLEDLFKLSLVGESRVTAELDPRTHTLLYRTTASGANDGIALDEDAVQALERIVWDNSAAGSLVTSKTHPRVTVGLTAGRHEFRALSVLAHRFPALARPALLRAAASG